MEEELKPKTKKSKKQKIIITILCLLIVGALVAGYFLLFPKKVEKVKVKKKEVQNEYRITGNDLNDFDLYFLKLENEEKNKIYSPLSIKYALEMLGEGASGDTKKQIDDVIGSYKAKKYTNSPNMSFANAMFIRDEVKDNIKKSYTDNLAKRYYAEVKYDSFANANNVNNWVKEKTLNLIPKLFSDGDVAEAEYYLINALAIDMNWTNQIHCAAGSKVPCKGYSVYYAHEKISDEDHAYNVNVYPYLSDNEFAHLDFENAENRKAATVYASFNRYDIVKEIGKDKIREIVGNEYKKWLASEEGKEAVASGWAETNVDKYLDGYIRDIDKNYGQEASSSDFYIYDDEKVKVFAKDLKEYDGLNLQYVGIMPKEDDLTDYIDNVKATEINKIIKNLKELKKENFKDGVVTLIEGGIPMFNYDYELELMSDLQKIGIKDVFDKDKADLSGMLKESKDHYIGQAKHKATIEFSNDGIKAAAVTAEGGLGGTTGGFDYFFKVPVEEIDLNFNKPYLFLIRDKDSGEVWFAGTVYEPEKHPAEKPKETY